MKAIGIAAVALVGWAVIVSVATCPAFAEDTTSVNHRPVIIRVNRKAAAKTGDAAHPVAANVQVPVNVLIADADCKEVTVPPGAAQAQLVFQLLNVSAEAVTIRAVQTSCGCTIAELPSLPLTLAPGAAAPITVTMNLGRKAGVVAKTATIVSDRGIKTLLARVKILGSGAAAAVDAPPRSAAAGH